MTSPEKKTSPLPTIVIDTREQEPYDFKAGKSVQAIVHEKLDHGDYGLKDYAHLITIERKKSVDEISSNLGKHRARFIRELERMQSSKKRYIVIEDHWSSIYRKNRYSKVHPNAIFESILALCMEYDVHVIFAGSRKMAHKIVRSLLLRAFKYREELEHGFRPDS